MTATELVPHYWSAVENGLSVLTLYISVFSGFVIAAYVVGARLTSVQCVIATGAYIVFGGFTVWGTTVWFNAAYVVAKQLEDSRPELLPIDANPAYVSFVLLFAGILGGLKFMWDVRHSKSE
ncbi:hypothetical protein [Congregibacter sp.]|uniref:hypothetical protein n=1 Tax=Congregibacter sp. TaxID=2744308 RepID=UPI00385CB068